MRAERYVPAIYFGRPGALQALPYPAGDIDKPYDRMAYDFTNGAGTHRISKLAGGSRLYSLNWDALHVENYDILAKYWTGNMGTGPWALIDPSVTNMLSPNQAGATSLINYVWNDWDTGSSSYSMGSLLSNQNATFIHRSGAPRSLQWNFPQTLAEYPVMWPLKPYADWAGWPVVPGANYIFSCWARPDGTVATNVMMAVKLQWYNSSGVYLSETSGGDSFMTTWQRYSASGAPPAGAAYVRPIFVVTGSSIPVNGSVYIDEPMLEQDSVLNDWAPGTGVRPVEILSLTDGVPFATRMRDGIKCDMREVS